MGRSSGICSAALFWGALLGCYEHIPEDEAVSPDLKLLERHINGFYASQRDGDEEAALQYTAWTLAPDYPDAERTRAQVIQAMDLPKPALVSCRYDVQRKYGNIGRFIRVHCIVARGGQKYQENMHVAALFEQYARRSGKRFLIETARFAQTVAEE